MAFSVPSHGCVGPGCLGGVASLATVLSLEVAVVTVTGRKLRVRRPLISGRVSPQGHRSRSRRTLVGFAPVSTHEEVHVAPWGPREGSPAQVLGAPTPKSHVWSRGAGSRL